MTTRNKKMTNNVASPLVRAGAGLVGLVFCLVGGAIALSAGQALWSLLTQLLGHGVFTLRDALYVLVWVVFSLSLLAAGVALLSAAWRARRYNMVPGPTLYLAGASLMIIALFLLAAGVPIYAVIAGAVGAALMVAEYSSEHV